MTGRCLQRLLSLTTSCGTPLFVAPDLRLISLLVYVDKTIPPSTINQAPCQTICPPACHRPTLGDPGHYYHMVLLADLSLKSAEQHLESLYGTPHRNSLH
jgi:hypothetical protein